MAVSLLAFWSEKRVVHSLIRGWRNFWLVFMRDTSEYLLDKSRDSSYTIQEIIPQKYDIMIRCLWLRSYDGHACEKILKSVDGINLTIMDILKKEYEAWEQLG